ncbi:MAG: MarR family transcriptional regulator [Bacteroidales bacterium]|nr:MarR family transcriptional regulator [Bacteroidales bacterium]
MKNEELIFDLIFQLEKKYQQERDLFILSIDISQAEYNLFICLKNCDHYNSYSIADKMNLSLSRVSRIIDKMVRNNYLTRQTNKKDRRAIDIKITKKGEDITEKISNFIISKSSEIEKKLSVSDINNIKTNLSKLINIL